MNEQEKSIDIRLLAVAINSVREGRIAKGRDASNWSDNDAYCVDNIHNMLRQVQSIGEVDERIEALPLRDHNEKQISEGAKKISDLLNATDFADAFSEPSQSLRPKKAQIG